MEVTQYQTTVVLSILTKYSSLIDTCYELKDEVKGSLKRQIGFIINQHKDHARLAGAIAAKDEDNTHEAIVSEIDSQLDAFGIIAHDETEYHLKMLLIKAGSILDDNLILNIHDPGVSTIVGRVKRLFDVAKSQTGMFKDNVKEGIEYLNGTIKALNDQLGITE